MKPGRHSFLLAAMLAASLASSPAIAQRSVSGTIAGRAPTEAAAAAPPAAAAAAPAPTTASAPTPAADAASIASAAPATATASAQPAAPAAGAPAASAPAFGMALPSTASPAAPAPSATGSLLQTTLALMFVLALLVGLAWFLKRFGPKNFGGGSNTVRLVGALSVGARERILVVEVGEQWIVVGASPGRMNALATMPRQQVPDSTPAPAGLQGANFAEWFKQTIEKRNGK